MGKHHLQTKDGKAKLRKLERLESEVDAACKIREILTVYNQGSLMPYEQDMVRQWVMKWIENLTDEISKIEKHFYKDHPEIKQLKGEWKFKLNPQPHETDP